MSLAGWAVTFSHHSLQLFVRIELKMEPCLLLPCHLWEKWALTEYGGLRHMSPWFTKGRERFGRNLQPCHL
jgi:hypothetical protein